MVPTEEATTEDNPKSEEPDAESRVITNLKILIFSLLAKIAELIDELLNLFFLKNFLFFF